MIPRTAVTTLIAMLLAAQAVSAGPSLLEYDLDVALEYEQETVSGVATLTLANDGDGPMRSVPLLLNRLMRVVSVRDGSGATLRFTQRVTVFEDMSKWQVTAVEVGLAEPVPAGDRAVVVVEYEGHLTGYAEIGYLYVRDHIKRDFTILREDALAFPWVGVPSNAANRRMQRPPFGFSVSVTVPGDLVVAAGGRRVAVERDDGRVTYRYASSAPSPFFYVAIAPYEVIERDGLSVFHLPDAREGAHRLLQRSLSAAAYLDALFGPLGESLSLTVMQIPSGWGSQASLGAGVIQEAGAFHDPGALQQVYHELSHLWNARDLDRPSPRWNEGLATYLQWRLAAELDHWDGRAAAHWRSATRSVAACGPDTVCGRVPMMEFGAHALTGHSYTVGAVMFALLEAVMGTSLFDAALRDHFQSHRVTGTTTQDLVNVFVAAGGAPVQRVFDEWLFGTSWVERVNSTASFEELAVSYAR